AWWSAATSHRRNSCARSSTGSSRARRSELEPVRGRQAFLAQEGRVEKLGLVPRARVGEDRHHRVPGTEVARQADRAGDVDAARAAEHQSFSFHQVEDYGQGL